MLLAVSVATFMLLLDITVVNTALPSIAKGLGAGFNALQWVVEHEIEPEPEQPAPAGPAEVALQPVAP